ncbi:MAG: RnfABCDGE type electron transport complex subunit D [Limnochordia bacterium]|jgi:electron transport complex protein RnfD|nr:MAG: electron transporter RnfD [Peptococcaceae bacterium 1109]
MENLKLIISPSPHVRDGDTTPRIMFDVLISLLPAVAAAVYFFGFNAIRLVLLGGAAAVATEALFQKLRGKPITIWDGSALVTGILLALTVPPTLPSWMIIVGSAVGIAVGKQVFGGLGHNIFNPALVGRAFLTASFVGPMTAWTGPFDTITRATPLAVGAARASLPGLFFGSVAGSLGETSALAILLGGIYLFYRGILDHRITLGVLGTVIAMSFLTGANPIFELLAGGLLFGAIFMATDMVTSPYTPRGRWIFGIGIGFMVMLIRTWGSMPEGVTYAILFMNAVTPLINRWTRPRIYGQGVQRG